MKMYHVVQFMEKRMPKRIGSLMRHGHAENQLLIACFFYEGANRSAMKGWHHPKRNAAFREQFFQFGVDIVWIREHDRPDLMPFHINHRKIIRNYGNPANGS